MHKAKAKKLEVDIPMREVVVEGYIDDSISIVFENEENLKRGQNAIPFLVHGVCCPTSLRELVERKDGMQLIKLEGEGTPAERKFFLGWLLDTRELRIYLPMDKEICWINDIKDITRNDNRVKSKQMEQISGRLNRVGYILPQARYFLNKIRRLQKPCEKYGPQKISNSERNDFLL